MKSLPKIFIINNPKRSILKETKAFFEEDMRGAEGPLERVILHMPPLDADIAKELERIGCPLSDIIAGRIDAADSQTLTHFSTIIDVEAWKADTDISLGALFDEVKSGKKTVVSEAQREPETLRSKASK